MVSVNSHSHLAIRVALALNGQRRAVAVPLVVAVRGEMYLRGGESGESGESGGSGDSDGRGLFGERRCMTQDAG